MLARMGAARVTRYMVTVDGVGYVVKGPRAFKNLKRALQRAVRSGGAWVSVPVEEGHKRVLVTPHSTAAAAQWDDLDELDDAAGDIRFFPSFEGFD